MSREIKFRAWDKKEKQMILVNIVDFRDNSVASVETFDGYKIEGDLNFELMQFTGLLDKNGKEVYEGDIIHFSKYNQKHNETDQGIGIVKFDEFDYTYCLRLEDCKQIKPKPSGFFRGLGDLGSCEIIGNIYENPELITGGKNG